MRPTEFVATLRKGKLGPAYFLLGPDRFLHEECRQAIVHSLPPETREWCLADIEFEPGHLERELQNASQMPMLGGHSYYVFSDPQDFKSASDEDTEALRTYLEKPSPFSTLVFAAAGPDRRRRFIQLLLKMAQVVELSPLGPREAAGWARDFCRGAGVELGAELALALVEKFPTGADSSRDPSHQAVNLLWVRTELEKLLTARDGAKRIEADDLRIIASFREEHEIGKMLRAIAERKCAEALDILRALFAGKVGETLLLWCIADLFRQGLKSTGPSGFGRGGWGRQASPFSTWEIAPIAARNYKREELLQALRLIRRTDLAVKSSWKDAPLLLELLIWQITRGKEVSVTLPLGEGSLAEI
jgi:DNA polymerase III subunit delta